MHKVFKLFLIGLLSTGYTMADEGKKIYGYVEKVHFSGYDLSLSAKLDTGAKSASLNALHIQEIESKGKTYLRFIVPSKEGDVEVTAPYLGEVNIKSRMGERQLNPLLHKVVQRPVVLMTIRMGEKEQAIYVNLTNRKHFIYPMLLGREAIKAFNGVVDPALKYTTTTQDTHPS